VAVNTIIGHSNILDELIRLKQLESYWLLIIQNSYCTLMYSNTQINEQNAAWTSVYRRVFNCVS